MALLVGWLVVSLVIAGAFAAGTRSTRKRVAILMLIPTVSTGLLLAALFAAADELTIPMFVAVTLAAAAVLAAIVPSKGSRIAVLIVVPSLGLVLVLVLHGLLISCCAT